jgi:multiple sugar transport system permease protein
MRILKSFIFYLIVVAILLFFVSPLVWLLMTSFKNNRDAFALPPAFIFTPTFDNYLNVFGRSDFFKALFNSLLISVSATAMCIIFGSVSAYALAFFTVRKKSEILNFILSTRVAPPILMLLPVYFIAVKLGINDSYLLLIVIYMLMNLHFAILMLVTFFNDIPGEIREAARVDGCTEMGTFFKIILPTARGGIAATFILTMLLVWNEFFTALVLSGKETQTLPVLITSFMTFQGTEWGPLTAAASFIMMPMLIFGILVQKHLVKGMTMGALK